jgi:hypothetical protein
MSARSCIGEAGQHKQRNGLAALPMNQRNDLLRIPTLQEPDCLHGFQIVENLNAAIFGKTGKALSTRAGEGRLYRTREHMPQRISEFFDG